MIRALRLPPLVRQPFATSTTTTTTPTSPLQRLATQAWRTTTSSSIPTPSRGIHVATNGARIADRAGRFSTSTPFLRSSQAWRNTTATQKLLSRTQKRNFNWSWSRRSQSGGTKAEESLSLSGRLRKLSREYGWATVGVYLALSVLDFPFCFLLVKMVGTDRIGTLAYISWTENLWGIGCHSAVSVGLG